MQKEIALLPLFKRFIKDCKSGKRLKADGARIRSGSVVNYEFVYRHLSVFSSEYNFPLRIRPMVRLGKRQAVIERRYWKNFYHQFSNYLYTDADCYDNYVGSCFKCLRCFFNYLKEDRLIPVDDSYKKFHVRKEEIPVITLMPQQLKFLINDNAFVNGLSKPMQRTRVVVIFGCTVALRFSDIFNVKRSDIQCIENRYYLSVRSKKTDTETRIQLPQYIVDLVPKPLSKKSNSKTLFQRISLNQFNRNLRQLFQLAGWTNEIVKVRTKRGLPVIVPKNQTERAHQFCDLASSHTMRRTAITTMLMLGMPEYLVRKISGHSANSKAFYRYVNFAQSYLDASVNKVFDQLIVKHPDLTTHAYV